MFKVEPRTVAEAIANAKDFIRKSSSPKKITCENCTHLDYDNDGSTVCSLGISKSALENFNELNVRPCKEVR